MIAHGDDRRIGLVIAWNKDGQSAAHWNPRLRAITIFMPLFLRRYPSSRSHEEDLDIGLDDLKESIMHEMRHAMQWFSLMPIDKEQVRRKPRYEDHQNDYYSSPIEFDPMIGSNVREFIRMWNISEGTRKYSLSQSIKEFTGMSPSRIGTPFSVSSFFSALKKTSQRRYRIAVRKFVIELREKMTIV
jgi:hypothetical protein